MLYNRLRLLQRSGGRGMLPEDFGFRVPASAARVQTGRAVRPWRNYTAMQTQLQTVRGRLRTQGTPEAPGRVRLFQVARLQSHRFDVRVKARLRLQVADDRAVESAVRRVP